MKLAPLRKRNTFNNFRKVVKFGTDWFDSLLNTLWVLYNIFHNDIMHKSLNNILSLLGMLMFSCDNKQALKNESIVGSVLIIVSE